MECVIAKIDHVAVTQQKNVLTTLIGQKKPMVKILTTTTTNTNRYKKLKKTHY